VEATVGDICGRSCSSSHRLFENHERSVTRFGVEFVSRQGDGRAPLSLAASSSQTMDHACLDKGGKGASGTCSAVDANARSASHWIALLI